MGQLGLKNFDKIIIGAGLYGLYAAHFCGIKGERVLVLERDDEPFMRATYINQARVHMGYHYPRSYSTAVKSAKYFKRFHEDYSFCERTDFAQIYATSKGFSWTNAAEFKRFCKSVDIMCDDVQTEKYFNDGTCDGAFLTREYTYDALVLKDYYIKELAKLNNVTIECGKEPTSIKKQDKMWQVTTNKGDEYCTPYMLNATYAGVNNIHAMVGYEPFKIKYELCEIILCTVGDKLKDVGITVMDGPFFSIMPFGQTGLHSLTAVCHTPHKTSFAPQPTFDCMENSKGRCKPESLYNCNLCDAKPQSAWPCMSMLAKKYLKSEFEFEYHSSLFSMKPILVNSEVDDSRPTVVRKMCDEPTFISVLSGKINTVYDLDEFL